MTVLRTIWIVLSVLATVYVLVLGVPFWLAAGALGCAVLPPLLGYFVQGSASDDQVAELEAGLWLALATLAAASTGGAQSPLIILFAVAIGRAWSERNLRLVTEITGFSLLGYALGAIAGLGGPWVGAEHASALAGAFGFAGLVMAGVTAVHVTRGRLPETAAQQPAAQSPSLSEARLAQRVSMLETRLREADAARFAAVEDSIAAKEALERRTLFFAQTSHELRTPLNAIAGFADMMRNAVFGPLQPKYQEYAELIREGGRDLELVVDDVLDLARIDSGRYEILAEPVSLTELAEDAVRFMSDMAKRKQINLAVEDGEDVEAFADQRAVRQIALNLISNALKFTPEGGTVSVSAIEANGGALLAVSDTGAGISPEELVRLSRAFEQGEAGRKQKGAGLGLSVVRAFAELHGGRLDIESREGGGSTIAVFFPAETHATQA